MLRRIFLLQILLGWLIVVAKKLDVISLKTAASAVNASLNPNFKPITLFVAPNGNDSWSGRRKMANRDNNDGPLATLAGAIIAVRKLKSLQPQNQSPITVMLRGGTYFLSQPVLFQPEDSGSVKQPITYQSYPGETAIISGGKVISGWQQETVNNLTMWTVELPQDSSTTWQFQHLWVNGERRSRSHYPSHEYLQVQALDTKPKQTWEDGHTSLQYRQGDLPQINPNNFKDAEAELVVMSRWTESRLPIIGIDPTQRQIYFSKESVFQLEVGDLYYLDNALEFLTTPGQWYLDRQQAKLYYLPFPDEKLNNIEIIAPVIESLLLFYGNRLQNNYIQHLQFRNITFSHTDWQLPAYISGYNQNAWDVPGAVKAIASKNCTWSRCTFAHLGTYALELADDCQYNRIAYCSFFDLGGGGIKIGNKQPDISSFKLGQGTSHNFIINNHLFDGGKFFHSAVAIAVVKSHDNLIAHNHIHDYYYTGITVMGTWGFEPTPAYQNLIENNHIHHIGKLSNGEGPIISDMGGIYILGPQKGTKVRHNEIHDIEGLRYGGWGIYLDEGSSYILVEHNLVYKTSHGGFVQHYGRENLIRYNIFAFGKASQIHRVEKDLKFARAGNFISFRFENNIVYWQSGEFITGFDLFNSNEKYQSHVVFNHNIYWKQQQSDFPLGNLTWQQWQKRDRHSLITDPLFIAPQEDNFQLQPNSPAMKLGLIVFGVKTH
jgi:hypothetical protein